MKPIYLDYNATTPIDIRVGLTIVPYLKDHFGNPSSTHHFGQEAHRAVVQARLQVAELIDATPDEIIFTGGGSEASNHAIKGAVFTGGLDGVAKSHVIISSVEHPATAEPCEYLKTLGCEVTVIPVDGNGQVNPDDIRKALRPTTKLVSIMHSNNEVGTINPIREISEVARNAGVLLHTDVAQSLGKVPISVEELGVDLLTIAGHKLYAPKGIGVLYVRKGVKLTKLLHGAGHESGRRAGTENVPYIAGLGCAAKIAGDDFPHVVEKLASLRDRLHTKLLEGLGVDIELNGHPTERLPNTLNLNFLGHVGAELLAKIPRIAASTGSACHEGKVKLSPVLKAMGIAPEKGKGAVRLSVGRFATEAEIDEAAELLISTAMG